MLTQPALRLATLLCLLSFSVSAGAQPVAPARMSITVRHSNYVDQLRLTAVARAVCDSFTAWYGPCAVSQITITAPGLAAPDSANGRSILLRQRPIPYTRIQLRELCRVLAREWFPFDESTGSAWLAQGLAAHAAARYLEAAHGPTNLLDMPFAFPQLHGLGEGYLIRALNYVAASNRFTQPLGTQLDASLFATELLAARAAHFVTTLRRQVGSDTFDAAVRFYRDTGGAERSSVDNFIRAVSLESRRNVHQVFYGWEESAGSCDYAVTGVKARGDEVEIGLRRVGAISLPLEVELRYNDGTSERRIVDSVSGQTVRFPMRGRLRQVALDPERKLPESDRWNNYWPRRVELKPVFSLPSLDAYQLFYGPYAWYDNYHGFQLGAWMQGRQFVDAGFLRGRHMWTVSETYSTGIDDWHTGASYQTPLTLISDRLRASFLGDYSLMAAGIRLSLLQELGRPFGAANGLIDFGYRFFDLYDIRARDTLAWQKARTGEVRVRLLHSHSAGKLSGNGQLYLGRGQRGFGSDFSYWKASLEESHSLRLSSRFRLSVRGFCGAIAGDIPKQDRFYLSGGLAPNSAEPISWGYKGTSSAQEHWHYDADVNCRGFAGEYRSGRFAYGVNLHLDVLPFFSPFFDLGNVADDPRDMTQFVRPRMDAGLRFRLGPLYADFPFWRYSNEAGHEFAFRWMLGLKLGAGT